MQPLQMFAAPHSCSSLFGFGTYTSSVCCLINHLGRCCSPLFGLQYVLSGCWLMFAWEAARLGCFDAAPSLCFFSSLFCACAVGFASFQTSLGDSSTFL